MHLLVAINDPQYVGHEWLILALLYHNKSLSTWTGKNAGRSPHYGGFHVTFTTLTSWWTGTRWMSIGAEMLIRNRHILESKTARRCSHWRFHWAFSNKMSSTVKIIASFSDFWRIFESKVTLIARWRYLCDFQRFLSFRNTARNAGRSGKNAGNQQKCGISRTIAGRLTPMHCDIGAETNFQQTIWSPHGEAMSNWNVQIFTTVVYLLSECFPTPYFWMPECMAL